MTTSSQPVEQHETSDEQLLDLLRRQSNLGVAELATAMDVTYTAVKQRLNRLMGLGLVQRQVLRRGRGRPAHTYSLTERARRQGGHNFNDLALVLWNEIRAIENPEVRRGLIQRLAAAMARMYGPQVPGQSLEKRMEGLVGLFADRRVPMELDRSGSLPVLEVQNCPYPELAEQDRSICALEKMLFSELLSRDVRLSECRLEGANCCRFEPQASVDILTGLVPVPLPSAVAKGQS